MRQKLISASLATCLSVASVNSVVAQGDVPLFGEPVNSLPIPQYSCDFLLRLSPQFSLCKRSTLTTEETKRHYFEPRKDWSYRCTITGNVEVDFFNSSTFAVNSIILEGRNGNRLSKNVRVQPGTGAHVYILSAGNFCRNESSAYLYSEYKISRPGECLEKYSASELRNMQEQCRQEAEVKRQEAEVKRQRDIIYNNCVVARSRSVERSAMHNVRSICRDISKNPSALQRLRWGRN